MHLSHRIACLLQYPALIAFVLVSSHVNAADSVQRALLDKLEDIRHRNHVAAMGLVIVEGDRVSLLATKGVAELSSGQVIRNDAIFRVGSITKMFTGLLASSLDARGMISLEGSITSSMIPGTYSNTYEPTHPITLAQLLEHTAGLTDMSRAEWDYSDPAQLPLTKTLRLHPEARETRWPPGSHFSYTNSGPGLAAYLIELATQKPYEKLLAEYVLSPLGMLDTSVLPPEDGRLAAGYDTDGTTRIPYWHQIFRPFGAINSTLLDMSRFIRVFINRGMLDGKRVFAARTIERVETPTTSLAARGGLESGYGLGNYDWLSEGVPFRGHGGDADGYLSRMGYTRVNNSGYFLVITAFQGRTLKSMTDLVEGYLTQHIQASPYPVSPTLANESVEDIAGTYRRVTYRFPAAAGTVSRDNLDIQSRADGLFLRDNSGRVRRLLPTKEHLFRWPDNNRATLFIGPDASGNMYYLDGSKSYMRVDD